MNEVGNVCLFNTALFSLGYVTGFTRRFEDLWNIMPESITVFLLLGIAFKIGCRVCSTKESIIIKE